MRETLNVWAQYSEPLLGIMSKVKAKDDENGDLQITIVEPVRANPIAIFCIEEVLALIATIGSVLSGNVPEFTQVELPYPAPAYRARYEKLFRCPVLFDAKQAKVTIAKKYVNLPPLTNDEQFHQICLEHCGRILQQIRQSNPVTLQLSRRPCA